MLVCAAALQAEWNPRKPSPFDDIIAMFDYNIGQAIKETVCVYMCSGKELVEKWRIDQKAVEKERDVTETLSFCSIPSLSFDMARKRVT